MSAPMGSPKGNISLHPADENSGEVDYEKIRPRMEEELQNMNSRQRLQSVAMRLAYHVIKTPKEFIDEGKSAEQQEWAVMPDETSSEPDYKPLSKHRNRAEAVREMKNLENKAAREEESERRRNPAKEEPKPTEELPAGQEEAEIEQQKQEEEAAQEQPADESQDLQNEPQSGPLEQSDKEQKQPTQKAASRIASVERKWMDVEVAANHAWNRRQKRTASKTMVAAYEGFHPLLRVYQIQNEPWSHEGYFQAIEDDQRAQAINAFNSGASKAIGKKVQLTKNEDIDWDAVKKLSQDEQKSFFYFLMKDAELEKHVKKYEELSKDETV